MSRRAIAGRPPPKLQEWAENLGFRFIRLLMTPLGWRRGGGAAGWIGRNLGARLGYAKRGRRNLALIRPNAPEPDQRRVLSGVMDNFARTFVEYLYLPEIVGAVERFQVEGLEHLLAAREAAGGRLVVATAHFGNWEAVRAVAALHGAPLAIIYRAANNRLIDAQFHEFLTSTGWPAFRKGRDGARDLYAHVRGGGGAMILVDHRMGGAPLLDFLGQPAETSLAAAQLARKLGAPLLPAVARRTEDGFCVRFEPVVEAAQPDQMMQRVNDHIADWVARTPEQWFWLHRRWRVRDVGERARKFEGDAAARAEEA